MDHIALFMPCSLGGSIIDFLRGCYFLMCDGCIKNRRFLTTLRYMCKNYRHVLFVVCFHFFIADELDVYRFWSNYPLTFLVFDMN